jgi:sugar phosphate isomerase/epimerase
MSKITRRIFTKKVLAASAMAYVYYPSKASPVDTNMITNQTPYPVRLGGPVFKGEYNSPDEWIKALKAKGYGAAPCPVNADADDFTVNSYKKAAREANIVIAEVGVWRNTISPDEKKRKEFIEYAIKRLELADRIEARCCVNTAGSRADVRHSDPDIKNLDSDTFDLIVESIRKILDAVKPTRTFYALETMPWIFPHTVDAYVSLIKAIDRKGFAAHFDPVNLITCPERYFKNAAHLKEGFEKLGPYIKSCHAKDILQLDGFPVNITEVMPGKGILDYGVYLTQLSKLRDVPLIMEHMKPEEYPVAAAYIKSTGKNIGISFTG